MDPDPVTKEFGTDTWKIMLKLILKTAHFPNCMINCYQQHTIFSSQI